MMVIRELVHILESSRNMKGDFKLSKWVSACWILQNGVGCTWDSIPEVFDLNPFQFRKVFIGGRNGEPNLFHGDLICDLGTFELENNVFREYVESTCNINLVVRFRDFHWHRGAE